MAHSEQGSLWHRWDLHFHTPSSFDYEDGSVTNQQIVDRLVEESIRVVAITDHHTIDVERIRELQRIGEGKLTVLPGIELRDDHGGKPIHYICIFPEECNLEHVWTTFQGQLGLTQAAIAAKGGHEKVYVPIEEGAALTRDELHGVVTIHAGEKSNSIEEISNREQFQQRIKYDITKTYVDLMEIGQLKDIDVHLKTIFPDTGLDKPLVICSDNHNVTEYTAPAPLWLRADPTFRGLLMALHEPRDRVVVGGRPDDLVRVDQNPTKYIRAVSFTRKSSAPTTEQWFSNDTVEFNTGLVAIIGNKGSGKSALADMIGLAGASRNSDSFSFLSEERFRHPKSRLAEHFDVTIEWVSGETSTQNLSKDSDPEAVERVRYLPQEYVESVCNELAGINGERFERELKSVIFSHVPVADRLGHTTLDDLVRFQSDEKQHRIDTLLKQLREASRRRAALEAEADPAARRGLEEKIKQREHELEVHDKTKPEEVSDPSAGGDGSSALDPKILKALQEAEEKKEKQEAQIADTSQGIRKAERRRAVAERLLEKLENFGKEFEEFIESLREDANELELDPAQFAKLTINRTDPEKIRDEAAEAVASGKKRLDDEDPPGLQKQLAETEANMVTAQAQLDAPNKAYQVHLKSLRQWEDRKRAIVGQDDEPESLNGLRAAVAALDELPTQIEKATEQQLDLAMEIHVEKVAQAEVFRKHYGAVQSFIDSHELASDKLHLEFRAELADVGFVGRLLDLLALNRRGSFMGIDEGKARAASATHPIHWEDSESVKGFLDAIDVALHIDQRDGQGEAVQLKDQLVKGRKAEEAFELLYGLEYVQPRYVLRWEGKDLSMLSPGERGTLLLVFYLLIDKSDTPLIIDQPEGNLDNLTVAKMLVDCIKEARGRRQVFLVTHNPNLAVVCDADQIVHASLDKTGGNRVTYTSGALENPRMSKYVTDVLEGTRWAFGIRGGKYTVADEEE